MKNTQQILFYRKMKTKNSFAFGGAGLNSNPKVARPISCKEYMHVVLKSNHARNEKSFLRHEKWILTMASKLGKKLGVKILDIVVMSNHIHLLVKVHRRRAFAAYFKALCGLIVRRICKIKRGLPRAAGQAQFCNSSLAEKETIAEGSFFAGRPFSRIVSMGRRSFRNIKNYFELNRLERLGHAKADARKMTHFHRSSVLSQSPAFALET